MNVQEFVKETLLQVIRGVQDARDEVEDLEEMGDIIWIAYLRLSESFQGFFISTKFR